ncbi:DUF4252 domain-containing protein [Paracidobacterium acidisoli]|uniref:DUF4252 domain-containing protein n=1 Tax=Paracidobacterium acidisoli TaxID=2303751 RepID=A0A372IPS3_9BACT|nr:DUF4252 domain-containing protein [Paracidobacterium acidisoli]MBT9331275.1 DUF4252 domain-containing protein [Paracidobacterium acidisoli]
MRYKVRFTALMAAALLWVSAGFAQAQQSDWIPQGMETLAAHASFHTDFTFDKSMLDLANNFTGDEQVRQVVAKLRGISVHSFRYPAPGLYNPGALDAVRAQYRDRGWKHMVTAQSHAAEEHPGRTDLWIRLANGNVEGMVLMVANPTNVDLVAVDGALSPLDLLHLRGHFGIPRFSGDRFEDDK